VTDPLVVLDRACKQVDVDASAATLIRASENTLYLLPGRLVARVTRAGQLATAAKEVRVSAWLRDLGIPVVEVVPEIPQPVAVDGHAVTFWRQLPDHSHGSYPEVSETLRRLHGLRPPRELDLPLLAPFVRLEERIAAAAVFTETDRQWLLDHLANLRQQYAQLPVGLPWGAVHGDAWGGNIVTTANGPVILDLERFAYGPPEWDLTSIAFDHVTVGCLSDEDWSDFCEHYGHDVTDWAGYQVLRDARELRKVTFAAQIAAQYPHVTDQARFRLECVRGDRGPRPWFWRGVP
jgi:Phosphotransferase enzyme family